MCSTQCQPFHSSLGCSLHGHSIEIGQRQGKMMFMIQLQPFLCQSLPLLPTNLLLSRGAFNNLNKQTGHPSMHWLHFLPSPAVLVTFPKHKSSKSWMAAGPSFTLRGGSEMRRVHSGPGWPGAAAAALQ